MKLKEFFSSQFIQIVISTIVSTGIIAGFINYHYDKKIKAHEMKLEKYVALIDELAKVTANQADFDKLGVMLNGTLLYASDDVVREILLFNVVFAKARNERETGSSHFQITAEQMRPLFEAIRKELYLKSDAFKDVELRFFQKP
jgi:hypothetical protein